MSLESGLVTIEIENAAQSFYLLRERQFYNNLEENVGQITWESSDSGLKKTTSSKWLDEILFNANPSLRDQNDCIQPGDIIELVGPAACGKSSIMYELIVGTILPSIWLYKSQVDSSKDSVVSIPLGGKGKNVIFLDCDMRIDIKRIYNIAVQRIHQIFVAHNISVSGSESSMYQLVKGCLRKLYVFRPSSSAQLLKIIAGSPVIDGPEVGLVVIDSLSQFYWASKTGVTHLAKNQHYSFQQDLAQALKKLLVSQNAIGVVSSWPPFPRKVQAKEASVDFYGEQGEVEDSLNSTAWIHAVNYRLVIKFINGPLCSNIEISRSHPISFPGTRRFCFKIGALGLVKQ